MSNPFPEAAASPSSTAPLPGAAPVSANVEAQTAKASPTEPVKLAGKTSSTAVKRKGVWTPIRFTLWPKKKEPSEARLAFLDATDRIDELAGEIEKADASILWLEGELADQRARRDALMRAQAKAAVEARDHLAKMRIAVAA